jgi:Uma2 family endonuclease
METTLVSVDDYLHTAYEPDVDYLDGELEERNVGEFDHSSVQQMVWLWFHNYRNEWKIRPVIEQRTRLTPTRVRVPDVCVFSKETPIEQVFTRPPLIAIEILSPEDRHRRMQTRIDDYIRFEVKNIWVIDPTTREGWNCSSGDWVRTDRFDVSDSKIYLSITELFAQVDEERSQ